jgi:flavin reductase (DIM6/NTAB) family NADH-FMN oxidoreductase RutF
VFVGEVRQTHVQESVLTDGMVDIAKVNPLLFDMSSKQYWGLGKVLGNCWSVGKQLKR